MSTAIYWPEELPIPKLSGLASQYQKAFIRTEMDAGPAKQRLRYTAVPKQFTGALVLTEAKRAILDSFFVDTLGYGTLRFYMSNPQTGTLEEFRFTDMYTATGNDGGLYDISLPLERLA